MKNRMCLFFNRVQVVHRQVQQSWCSFSVTEFCDVRQCAIFVDQAI
jgi:hypothetical protein